MLKSQEKTRYFCKNRARGAIFCLKCTLYPTFRGVIEKVDHGSYDHSDDGADYCSGSQTGKPGHVVEIGGQDKRGQNKEPGNFTSMKVAEIGTIRVLAAFKCLTPGYVHYLYQNPEYVPFKLLAKRKVKPFLQTPRFLAGTSLKIFSISYISIDSLTRCRLRFYAGRSG
jgi:hypothetical protein